MTHLGVYKSAASRGAFGVAPFPPASVSPSLQQTHISPYPKNKVKIKRRRTKTTGTGIACKTAETRRGWVRVVGMCAAGTLPSPAPLPLPRGCLLLLEQRQKSKGVIAVYGSASTSSTPPDLRLQTRTHPPPAYVSHPEQEQRRAYASSAGWAYSRAGRGPYDLLCVRPHRVSSRGRRPRTA